MSTQTPSTPRPNASKQQVKTMKVQRKTACRIFGVIFLVVGILASFILPYAFLQQDSMPLYNAVLSIFPANWFTAAEGALNIVYNISIYVFALLLLISIIFAIIAIIPGKRRLVNTAGILLTVGAFVYTIMYTITAYVSTKIFGFDFISLILAVVALIATILCFIFTKPIIKKIVEEEEKDPNEGFHVEEYAEAFPYEGGPVAGVLMAEEVNPSFIPHEPRVNTAGYDFYNSKTFDPFIATLDADERNSFTELFILKVSGTMAELPDYVVGGDNKEFFRKIFIYLGQYRDKIPSNLLGKMYQYSLKLS